MSTYTTPRKSLRLRKTEPSPYLSARKRELFPVDNWDEDSHDIIPLQSSPDCNGSRLPTPKTPFSKNCTPITELSPTMSDQFEKLMSESKSGSMCSATIVIEETPNSRRVKHINTTPFESETNKEVRTPFKRTFNFNNKTELRVKTSSFYGGNQISLEDIRVKRFTRLYSNPKVKAKLFKDSKSTSKKRSRSNHEQKPKTNFFPGVILPFKKKLAAKKLFIKPELCDEKYNVMGENVIVKKNSFDSPKPSSSKKSDWTQYIKQEKPQRIKVEQPDNRKFFKSTVVSSDTPNKKDNSFNYNVVNWGSENKMSTLLKVEESEFNSIEILDDNANDHVEKEVNDLIDLLHDDESDDEETSISTAVRYPGLSLKSTKRDHENSDENSSSDMSSKRMKTDVQNENNVYRNQMPDLIRDAYGFDKNCIEDSQSSFLSPVSYFRDVSNTVESPNMAIDETTGTSNDTYPNVINESPQTKLFSIFTNQTTSPSHIVRSAGKSTTVRRAKRVLDAAQYQIDAGQKKFGGFMCKQCGLYYSRGEPEDETEHDKYHEAKEIFKYNCFKNEKVVYHDSNERIVVISGSDSKVICSKALEVMSFIDQELGFNLQNTVLPSTKKVYLYIKNKQVVGCLVVELMSQAYRNIETETEDMVIVSEESYPIKVGVNRIWTKWDCRKNGIATKLLDCFRKSYAYGHILSVDEIAFTVPTRAGKQFIKKYTKKNDYLVYTGW